MSTVGLPGPDEPLLEREGELEAVARLLSDARAGRGRLLLLEAQAGIGKSTLIEHAAALATHQRFLVLRTIGREIEHTLGWGIARGLFEGWLHARSAGDREAVLTGPAAPSRVLFEPDRPALTSPAAEVSFGILHGLYWLASRIAEETPLLLVVDDAHWADEPSVRFLTYLAGRIRDQPIATLVATRPSDGRVLEHLRGDSRVAICEPAPLSAGAVTELVRRRVLAADAELCRRCFELTGGNPLYVRELVSAIALTGGGESADLDAGIERAARSLSRLVLRRLGSLTAAAQALARVVTVFESGVPLHLACEVAHLSLAEGVAAADELGRAEILGGEDPLNFAHPLTCHTVYRALPRAERARTHGRAAVLLAAAGAGSEEVAAHLLDAAPAGDPEAVERLRRAARSAMSHGVPSSAVAYLQRAIREPPSAGERPLVLAELGRAEFEAGLPEALEHLEAAIDLVSDPLQRARWRLDCGLLLHARDQLDEACSTFQRGIQEVGPDGGELALELEAGYLTAAMISPVHAADAQHRAAAIVAREAQIATPSGRVLASKALLMRCWSGGRRDEMLRIARHLFADGRLIDEGGIDSYSVWDVIAVLSYCDDYDDAERAVALTLADVARRGSFVGRSGVGIMQARLRLWTGPIAYAVEDATVGLELRRGAIETYVPISAYYLTCGALELGRPEQAEHALALAGRQTAASGWAAAHQRASEGHLATYRGEHERALRAFLAAGESLARVSILNPAVLPWRSQAALAAHQLGRGEQAGELVAAERRLAEQFGAPRAIGVAMRAAGLVERGETAVSLLESATATLARCGARVEHARALADLGAAVRRAGRPKEARAMLRGAIRIAEEVDARAVAHRAREELQRAGGRMPSRHESDDDLTPSERRVAELAASGRTNREIANELFVTIKAVEWHLGNAYRKLDIRGRSQLAVALAAKSG
jgi:DNA-binding CsgD family transcriptional regulator